MRKFSLSFWSCQRSRQNKKPPTVDPTNCITQVEEKEGQLMISVNLEQVGAAKKIETCLSSILFLKKNEIIRSSTEVDQKVIRMGVHPDLFTFETKDTKIIVTGNIALALQGLKDNGFKVPVKAADSSFSSSGMNV